MTIRQSFPWAPGAVQSSGPYTGGPAKLLFHATIAPAMALPDYAGQGEAPHATFRWDGSKIIPSQHYFWDNFSKGLVNAPGGVETNRDGVRQIELAGYLDDRPGQFNILKAPDEYWIQVAHLLAPVVKDIGIPNVVPKDWSPTGRMDMPTWDNYWGICAHVHVPENNHTDLNIPAHALSVLQANMFTASVPKVVVPKPPVVVPPTNPPFPLYSGNWFGELSPDPHNHSGTFSAYDRNYIRMWQTKMRNRGWNIAVTGIFDKQSGDIAAQFQREKGLVPDRRVGPLTWRATWLAPIT